VNKSGWRDASIPLRGLQPILDQEIYVIRVWRLNPASRILSGYLSSVVVTMSKKMVDDIFNSRMIFSPLPRLK
jgi:hypothetical protein